MQDDIKQSESSNDAPVPLQEASVLSSSTLELEDLVILTVAPATPTYDSTESSATIATASSIASNAQASSQVLSSVILIPPSNPGQVHSSDDTQRVKESTYSEATKEPEVLTSVVDSR